MEYSKVRRIREALKGYNEERKTQFTAMSYVETFKGLLEELIEDEPIMSPEEFKERLEEAEASNDWRDVLETIRMEQESNNERICYHEMPLSNIAIEYLSELAHDNVMQDVSYEDYLTDEQAEVYRTALSI